jgi:multidrug efflux pump
MGDGGPRFILALNPPTPAAHRAYAVLTLAPGASHAAGHRTPARGLAERFPMCASSPSASRWAPPTPAWPCSASPAATARATAPPPTGCWPRLQAVPGIVDLNNDAERHILQLDVQVDQVKAQAAGVSSADIARSLALLLEGSPISQYRDGDTVLPIVLRGEAALRRERGRNWPPCRSIAADGSGQRAAGPGGQLKLTPQQSVMQRYNQQRTVTVHAKHAKLTAQGIADRVAPLLGRAPRRRRGHRAGRRDRGNASANDAIVHCCRPA